MRERERDRLEDYPLAKIIPCPLFILATFWLYEEYCFVLTNKGIKNFVFRIKIKFRH